MSATEQEIEALWDQMAIVRVPGRDMTNECRLAARIINQRKLLAACITKLRDFAKDLRKCVDSGQCFQRAMGIDYACSRIEELL